MKAPPFRETAAVTEVKLVYTLQHSVHPDAGNEGTFTFIGGAPALSSANPVRGVSPKHSLV